MSVEILKGDAFETLKTLSDKSIQCCVTSPPYYGLRDYGVEGQIGLEPTPEEYVAKMVSVFREMKRVLKDDGTFWLNIGDSYATQHTNGMNDDTSGWSHGKISKGYRGRANGLGNGVKPKDLIGIPWMLAFALRNDGWWLRSDIIWHKPNPMPESVKDRPTKSHEYIFLLSKSQKYYYDAEAIKEESKDPIDDRGSRVAEEHKRFPTEKVNGIRASGVYPTRNKRDVWTVTTKPYKGAHFATFPPDLIEPCILAGSKEGDTILDPFNGSGTTGEVSIKHRRNYIGIELNPEYIELSKNRLNGASMLLPGMEKGTDFQE